MNERINGHKRRLSPTTVLERPVKSGKAPNVEIRNGATDQEEQLIERVAELVRSIPPTHSLTIEDNNGRPTLSLYREESRDARFRVGSITAGRRIRR